MDLTPKICRLCLGEEGLLIDCSLNDDTVQAKITTVFSFSFDSGESLPSGICTDCNLKIDEYYEFSEKVRQNQEQLIPQETLPSRVKIKFESTEGVILDEPIVVEDSVSIDPKTTITEAEATEEVISDEAVEESIAQTAQDEGLQLKIEIEDTELQSSCGKPTNAKRIKKTTRMRAKEDRLIEAFFDLVCKVCSKQFDCFARLKAHTRVAHKKRHAFTCCNKQHSTRNQMLEHITLHSNPQKFRCDSCDKKYQRQSDLDSHRLLAHSGEEARPFKCDHCPRSYPKRYMLTAHMMKHDRNKVTCSVCHQVYANWNTMRAHKARVHVEGAHECVVCGKKFKRRLLLKEHYALHTGEELYTCDLCGQRMNSSSNLHRHRKKKHGNEKQKES